VIHQLRIYEIFESNKAAFHERFRDHATRIMGTYGFRILAMWEARSDVRTEFVYLLEWPDQRAMTEAWEHFLADEEWKEIKRATAAEHGVLVGEIEDRQLAFAPYSPMLTRP
jgi:heme-degrading monooxygenase HmoA